MPTYDYRCEVTGEIFEVKHKIGAIISTWAELCELNQIEPGDIPLESEVTKLLSAPGLVKSSSLKNPAPPPCMTGGGCPSGGCS